MATVERYETYDVNIEERGEEFVLKFDEPPTFKDQRVADHAAHEIHEVLKRLGSQ